MERGTRLKTIRSHIAALAQTEEEALQIINDLMREDWDRLIAISHSHSNAKWVEQLCVVCKMPYRGFCTPTSGMCSPCSSVHGARIIELHRQRIRATKRGLPATLTLRQWFETLEYFQGRCAYCSQYDERLNYGVLIEHFIPIDLGGGTTKDNCVPGCYGCNARKRAKHPDKVLHAFPEGAIQRVREYLQMQSWALPLELFSDTSKQNI